jgi:hypothetical protein
MSFVLPLSLFSVLFQSTFTFATTFPTILEIDLQFPLNKTYSPTESFPFLFALQNAPLFPSLGPQLLLQLWDITSGNGLNVTDYSPQLSLSTTNFTLAETIFVYTSIPYLPVGLYALVWSFGNFNCSAEDGSFESDGGFRNDGVEFAIQDGAQVVDIAAPLTNDECAGISHFALNVTGTLEITNPGEYDGRNTCAVIDEKKPLVRGNPCAVSVGTVAASSIEAQITKEACAFISPAISCAPSPTTTKMSDAGGRYWGGEMGMGIVLLGGFMVGLL